MSIDTPETVAARLEAFIRERFKVPSDDRSFTRTAGLWEEGYIDSIGVAEMIAFLEGMCGVTITNDVIFSPDFTTIDGIAGLVVRLRQGKSSAKEADSSLYKTGTAA